MVYRRYIGPARKQKFDHRQISTPVGYRIGQRLGNIGAGIEQHGGFFETAGTHCMHQRRGYASFACEAYIRPPLK